MSHANYSLTFRAVIPAQGRDARPGDGRHRRRRGPGRRRGHRALGQGRRDAGHHGLRARRGPRRGHPRGPRGRRGRARGVGERPRLPVPPGRGGRHAEPRPAHQPRRPLDGLHARRGPRLHGDPPRLRPGLGLHDQGQQRHGRERRQLGRGPGRPRPRGLAAGARGQVRVHAPPRGHRRLPAPGRPARPGRDRRGRRALLVGLRGHPPERHRGAALLRGPAPAGRAPRRPGLPRGPAGDRRRRARRPHQRPVRRRQGPLGRDGRGRRASARAGRPWCGCWSRPAPAR